LQSAYKPGVFATLFGALLILAFAPVPCPVSSGSGKVSVRPASHRTASATNSIHKAGVHRTAAGVVPAAAMPPVSLAPAGMVCSVCLSAPAPRVAGRPSGRSPPLV
jgi:hypothetical protein